MYPLSTGLATGFETSPLVHIYPLIFPHKAVSKAVSKAKIHIVTHRRELRA